MNTTNHLDQKPSGPASIPRWMALLVALAFWLVGVPLFYGVLPWLISYLTPRYGWSEGSPSNWNLFGLIPIVIGTICLIWIMILHFAKTPAVPQRIELERTPKYLLLRGPYAFSRNPMYLAELTLLLGWAIYYGSVAILIAFLVACVFFHFVIVPREERALERGALYRNVPPIQE